MPTGGWLRSASRFVVAVSASGDTWGALIITSSINETHSHQHHRGKSMIGKKVIFCCAALMVAGPAFGQVELNTYMDSNGYLDVQKLTCAQLAGTFQEDADYLAAWYSGWYNGLAKKHVMQIARAKALQHEVIVYCKANPSKKVIEA